MNIRILVFTCVCLLGQIVPAGAQSIFHRADSILTQNYSKGNVDTAYVMRPATKWTITARMNVSGAKISAEGINEGRHFKSETIFDSNFAKLFVSLFPQRKNE